MPTYSLIEKIEHFRQALKGYEDSYILIGGAACSLWYADKTPLFRATGDLDIVLIVEALSEEFVGTFKTYILQSGYAVREKHCWIIRPHASCTGSPTHPTPMLPFNWNY